MDQSIPSWKEDEMIAQLHDSIENAAQAVGRAQSKPTEEHILDAKVKLEHADHSFSNAIQTRGQSEPVQRLQEQLNESKERMKKLH